MIKEVKLNGSEITKITWASMQVRTPSDGKGHYSDKTFAPTVTVRRNASDDPNVQGFKLATNGDGRKEMITASLSLVDGADKAAYSFDIKRAFVSSWVLDNPSDAHSPTTETIELNVGEVEANAGGKGAKLNLDYMK